MSMPYQPNNQPPFQPQQGAPGYPAQGGYAATGGVPQGGYAQGGYVMGGAPQGGYPQGGGNGMYGQPPYGGGAMGPQPSGSNVGKIVAIIAGAFAVALVVGLLIYLPFLRSSSNEETTASPTSAASPSGQPSMGSAPSDKATDSPSSPSKGGTPSKGNGADGTMEQQVISACKDKINQEVASATITNDSVALKNQGAATTSYEYTGQLSGTRKTNNRAVSGNFTCTAIYVSTDNSLNVFVKFSSK